MSYPEYSKRDFLTLAGKSLLTLASFRGLNRSSLINNLSSFSYPEGVLNDKELKKYNIRVCPTTNTKLYLKQAALNIPFFNDAKEGKIDEGVVVLVEDNSLTYQATRLMPEDARMLWDAIMPENIDNELLRGFFVRGGTRSYLYSNNEKLRHFLDNHPQYKNRMYIYLSAGGDLAPRPEYSYPSPELILTGCSEEPVRDIDYYRFFPRPKHSAFVLYHELGHYHLRSSRGEWMADNFAIDAIAYNYAYYQRFKDPDIFPFVFVNNWGYMVT